MPRSESKARRNYALYVPQRLAQPYGVPDSYTADEVTRVLDTWDMRSEHEAYADALLTTEAQFGVSPPGLLGRHDYHRLREEILASELDLGPDARTTDILRASYERLNPSDAYAAGGARFLYWLFALAALLAVALWGLSR